jgi:hypothetical protein
LEPKLYENRSLNKIKYSVSQHQFLGVLKLFLYYIWNRNKYLSLQAFEQYDSVEDSNALLALKYMLMSKIMLNLPDEVYLGLRNLCNNFIVFFYPLIFENLRHC